MRTRKKNVSANVGETGETDLSQSLEPPPAHLRRFFDQEPVDPHICRICGTFVSAPGAVPDPGCGFAQSHDRGEPVITN